MKQKEKNKRAQEAADAFLKACDGMNAGDVADILHLQFLYSLSAFCDSCNADFKEVLLQSIGYFEDVLQNVNNTDKTMN